MRTHSRNMPIGLKVASTAGTGGVSYSGAGVSGRSTMDHFCSSGNTITLGSEQSSMNTS